MLRNLLLVALGGAAGSMLRYLLSVWIPKAAAGDFPWATFGVNLMGSFLIGMLMGKFGPEDTTLRLLLVTGCCGGFTTFSAFAFENVQLLQSGNYAMAVSYMVGSVLLGIALVFAGLSISSTV